MRERSRSSSSSSQSSRSYKGEDYPEESEEREESTTGFDKSRLGTKDFAGPERGRARGTFVSHVLSPCPLQRTLRTAALPSLGVEHKTGSLNSGA